jgi:hypothetical protein
MWNFIIMRNTNTNEISNKRTIYVHVNEMKYRCIQIALGNETSSARWTKNEEFHNRNTYDTFTMYGNSVLLKYLSK